MCRSIVLWYALLGFSISKSGKFDLEFVFQSIYLPQRRHKMPKMKTHRAAAKRYKVTGTGKITRRHAGIGHLLQHKSESRKRKIFGDIVISETHEKLVSKELPYKKYSR